jgi:hypothetical protein
MSEQRQAWTAEEENILLRCNKENKTLDEIAALFENRSRGSVAMKLSRMNLKSRQYKVWTETEIDQLRQYRAGGMKLMDIAQLLDRPYISIVRKLGEYRNNE